MTTQLQQCREVAAALDEEVTEWRRKDAEWREHRNAAEKALHDMPFVMDNYRAALARAEVLEVAFANSHNLNESLGDENRALLARAEAAEAEATALAARVAALEAALAAQEWRPVTEKPAHAGYYLCATRDPMVPMHVVWHTPDGAWYVLPDERVLTHWRPLPPPPDAATMEAQP